MDLFSLPPRGKRDASMIAFETWRDGRRWPEGPKGGRRVERWMEYFCNKPFSKFFLLCKDGQKATELEHKFKF